MASGNFCQLTTLNRPLAKCTNSALDKLVLELPNDTEKLAILGILTDQVSLLFQTGRTNPERFLADLKGPSIGLRELSPTICGDARALAQSIQDSTASSMVALGDTEHTFKSKSITKLDGKQWLNDEIIIACLHLSDKLPFVRVGFSVPLSQRSRRKKGTPGPFQRASNQINAWHKELSTDSDIVCFFPLCQHENHFSLLEINEIDGCIYHYDSLNEGDNDLVKVCDTSTLEVWS